MLKCSHLFNVLDARGAIGVTERASYFRRMRDMTRNVARAYALQRDELGYPLNRLADRWGAPAATSTPAKAGKPSDQPADVLLEIGVEELPAGDVDDALDQLRAVIGTLYKDLRLPHEGVKAYATPRRLVIHASRVEPRQLDVERVEKGPPASRAFDDSGAPTKAAEGFARSRGVPVDALRVEEIDGGEYVVATVREEGRPALDVLQETLPQVIAGLKFGKSMRWNDSDVAFSRPIRWLVALVGDVVIPFEYAGVASGSTSRGLRPYDSPPLPLSDPASYFEAMTGQGIILDREERQAAIVAQVNALAQGIGGRVPEDPGLLAEVTNLVEAPTALLGSFEQQYLELPREVLVTVMRKHQRYFPVEDASGNLMAHFIAVRNGDDQHLDQVVQGNEHVLRARFADAEYFYKEDVEKPLAEHLPRLGTLTFEEHLGSMLDKNQRVAGMVAAFGALIGTDAGSIATAQAAAQIAKADLATRMVVEMTSLQGIMGREYALRQGVAEPVANAIFEHWLPRNADDILPPSSAGQLLALLDRLDSLTGLFAAGLAPKSTADPYGLRRAALGVVLNMARCGVDADLAKLVELVAAAQPIPVDAATQQQVLDFIAGRLRVWLQEQGWRVDIVNAVLAQQSANPARALAGVRELSEWVKRDDWEPILDGFARCVRITRAEPERYPVDVALFEQDEEHALYDAVQAATGSLNAAGNVNDFLTAFVPLLPAITAFFGTGRGDGVLVNAEDPAVRRNRLGLLQAISSMQAGRADLSELTGF